MWRAPLAGLASLAMVATMGVAASTANAATADGKYTVNYNGNPYEVWAGESFADAYTRAAGDFLPLADVVNGFANDYKVADPVTGDVTITSNSAPAAGTYQAVTVDLKDAKNAVVVDGIPTESDFTLNVKNDEQVGKAHTLSDAGNGWLTDNWTISYDANGQTIPLTGQSLADVLNFRVTSDMSNVKVEAGNASPANKIEYVEPAAWGTGTRYAHLAGSFIDTTGGASRPNLVVDLKNGDTLPTPTSVYDGTTAGDKPTYVEGWKNAKGQVLGKDVTTATESTKFVPTGVQNIVVVSFDANGGSQVAPQYLPAKGGHVDVSKTATTKDNYFFKNWKINTSVFPDDGSYYTYDKGAFDPATGEIKDLSAVYFKKSVELEAVWAANFTIKVTFHYGDYAGAPADETKEYAANAFVDQPASPTRDGYTLSYWVKADGNQFDFDNTLSANGAIAGANNFVLTAKWQRDYQDKALQALNYVKVGAYHEAAIGVNAGANDDSVYFKNWDAFKAEYEKAYKEYRSAYYAAPNNEIDSKTADEVINTLTAAWKALRFDTSSVDAELNNGDSDDAATDLVYRLSTPDGVRHLLTADENEVLTLTNKYQSFGGWNRDANTFKVVNQARKVTVYDYDLGRRVQVARVHAWTGSNGFPALVTKVTRLYNDQLQEWLYTSDDTEIKTLTAGDWTKDSDAASFYVPAQYKGNVKVTRLYNKGLHQHLYTSDQHEVSVLLGRGWTKDSDAAAIYGL